MQYTSLSDLEVLRLVKSVLEYDGRTSVGVNKQLLNELAERFERMLSSVPPAKQVEADPNQLKLF